MKTLIIEDGLCSAEVTQRLMQAYGECDVAYTGEEGFEKYKTAFNKDPYTLIFLDIVLPGKSGNEILKEIKAYEGEESITKIVMLTANDDNESIMSAFKEQCEGYIVKPINKDKIVKCLTELELIK